MPGLPEKKTTPTCGVLQYFLSLDMAGVLQECCSAVFAGRYGSRGGGGNHQKGSTAKLKTSQAAATGAYTCRDDRQTGHTRQNHNPLPAAPTKQSKVKSESVYTVEETTLDERCRYRRQ